MKIQALFSGLLKAPLIPAKSTTPHLRRPAEFERALHNYHPSHNTLQTLRKTKLITLTAPSATGRNTIINELKKTGRYDFIVSDTTRPRRTNNGVWEQDGIDYYFRKENDVLADIKAGRFVEAEVIHSQQVSGISGREIERVQQGGKIPIADVDIEGGINLARLKPDTVTICVLPPSFDAWLNRLQGRGKLKPVEIYRRLQGATKVLKLALAHDHFIFVINDNLQDAIQAVDDIATKGIHHAADEQKARKLAEDLYHQTKTYLAKHAPKTKAY